MDEVGFQILKDEVVYINELLKMKSIPTPTLLKKTLQNPNPNGQVMTRMVITAKNIMATFTKVIYLRFQKTIKHKMIYYSKYTITQAPKIKEC